MADEFSGTEAPEISETPKKDPGVSYLFNADAQAILESVPTLESGLEELSKAYESKDWDNKDEAKKVAETYSDELYHRFKDQSLYSTSQLKEQVPISFHEIEGKDDLEKLDNWEKANKDFLDKTYDPAYVVGKSKLVKSIEYVASDLRRKTRANEAGIFGGVADLGYRALEGATAAPAKLLGMDSYVKGLRERTNPSYDDDIVSDITSGAGTLVGATASTLAGGPVGTWSYLGATAAGQVKERYDQSIDATGDKTKAAKAAAIEAGAQAVMLGVGGKMIAAPAAKIFGKVTGKVVAKEVTPLVQEGANALVEGTKKVLKSAAVMGATQAGAGAVSNIAQNVGTDSDIGLTDHAGRNFIVGTIFGAGIGGMDVALTPKLKADPTVANGGVPPPVEKTVVGGVVDRGPVQVPTVKTEPIVNEISQTVKSPDAYKENIEPSIGKSVAEIDSEVKTIQPSSRELELSSKFGKLRAAEAAWKPGLKNAAREAITNKQEYDYATKRIADLELRSKTEPNPESGPSFAEQITEYQKLVDELAPKIEKGYPGVREAEYLTKKESIAAELKQLRLERARAARENFTLKQSSFETVLDESIPLEVNKESPKNALSNFTTEDGNSYAVTEDGTTSRTKAATREKFYPMDKTFYVDKETAVRLGTTRLSENAEGSTAKLTTDGENLIVVSVNPDGSKTSFIVPADMEPAVGKHPVEVNTPKVVTQEKPSSIIRQPYRGYVRALDSIHERILKEKYPEHESIVSKIQEQNPTRTVYLEGERTKGNYLGRFGEEHNPGDPTTFEATIKLNVPRIDSYAKKLAKQYEISKEEALSIIYEMAIKHENTHAKQFETLGLSDFLQQTENEKGIPYLKRPSEVEAQQVGSHSTVKEAIKQLLADKALENANREYKPVAAYIDPIEYRSHIGREIKEVVPAAEVTATEDKSAGAMSIYATRERGLAKRLRMSPALDEKVKSVFGDAELGLSRYFEVSNIVTKNEAGKIIGDVGLEKATRNLLELPEDTGGRLEVEQGHQLVMHYNEAAKAARKAGDIQAYEKLSDLASHVADKTAEIGTSLGQAVQAFAMWKDLDPDMRITALRKGLDDEAVTKVSREKGIAPETLKALPDNIKKLDESISAIESEGKKIQSQQPKVEGQAAKEPKEYLPKEKKEELKVLTDKKAILEDIKAKLDKAKQEKQKRFNEKDEDAIRRLVKILPSLKEGTTNYNRTLEALLKIEEKINGKAPINLWRAYWYANVLSNPATHVVNIVSNAMQTATIPMAYAVTGNSGAAGVFIKSILQSIPESLKSSYEALKTGETKVRTGKFETKSDLVKEGPKFLGLNKLGYVLRALSAEDEFFYHSLKEAQAKTIAYLEGRKLGLSGEELRQKIAKDLNNSPEAWTDSLKEAQDQAATLKEYAGVELTPNQIRNSAWEIMESKRPDLIRNESHRFALEQTFNNTPKGFIGDIVRGISRITDAEFPITINGKSIKPLAYVTPFMKIGGNIANAFLDYTPIGALRAAFKNERTAEGIVPKATLQRSTELGRFILGTIATGTLYGIAREFIDDKDPYFAIYGPGPKDADMKNQLRSQKNWMPYSLKIGNTIIPFKYTPLVFPLGAIGAIHDQIRWSKRYEKANEEDALSLSIAGMVGAFVDNSFFKTISDTVAMLQGDQSKDILDIPINIGKGFLPASGALRAISNITDDPIVTKKNLWAKIMSGIPIAQSIGTKPSLNTFGDPIEKTLAERLSMNRFWDVASTDPDWQWLAHNGYDLPDAGGTDTKLSTKERPNIAKQREKNYGAIFSDQLTQDERYLLTEKSGPDIRRVVQKYRARYGNSGYQQRVQDELKADISKVRSNWKKKLFLH